MNQSGTPRLRGVLVPRKELPSNASARHARNRASHFLRRSHDRRRTGAVRADGAEVLGQAVVDGVRTVRLLGRTGARIGWSVSFE
jgi:hypothetical protein